MPIQHPESSTLMQPIGLSASYLLSKNLIKRPEGA